MGSKFGVSMVFNVAYVGNVQIFATNILGTTFGICNFTSRVSTILAPYVAELKPESISEVVFCVVIAIAMVSALQLRVPKKNIK